MSDLPLLDDGLRSAEADALATEFPELQEPVNANALMEAVCVRARAERRSPAGAMRDWPYVRETYLMQRSSGGDGA